RFPDDNVRCAGFPFKEFAWYGFAQFEGDAVVGIGQWCEGSTDTGAQLELDADPAIIGVVDDFLDNAVETTDTVGFLEFRKGHAAVFGCVLDALVANIFYAEIKHQVDRHIGFCDFQFVALGAALIVAARLRYHSAGELCALALTGRHDAVVDRELEIIGHGLQAGGAAAAVVQIPVDKGDAAVAVSRGVLGVKGIPVDQVGVTGGLIRVDEGLAGGAGNAVHGLGVDVIPAGQLGHRQVNVGIGNGFDGEGWQAQCTGSHYRDHPGQAARAELGQHRWFSLGGWAPRGWTRAAYR